MFWMRFSFLYHLIFFIFLFFLPVTWMTVRSLKFQRTAWTREQSRSDLNALSCSKFWGKVAMERWDSLIRSSVREWQYDPRHSCTLLLYFTLGDWTWLEVFSDSSNHLFNMHATKTMNKLQPTTVQSCIVGCSLWALYRTHLYYIGTFD